jgi:hypothetical protein
MSVAKRMLSQIFFLPPHVPYGCGRSVTDFWDWDAHEAQLRCVDEVDGDIWVWSTRRGLNLSPRPWSQWKSSPSRKNPHGRTGNRTRDLMISSQKLWPLDYEAGLSQKLEKLYYEGWGMWKYCHKIELWRKRWKMSKMQKFQLGNQEGYWKLNEETGFMFCWPCGWIFFVMKTNQLHCLSLVYFVTQPLHVSGMFIAHHQEVFTIYIYTAIDTFYNTFRWLAAGWFRMEHST